MQIVPALRVTAAAVTLIAGLFSAGVRFGPMVAPEQHEAAMISLAAAFGEDIGPVKGSAQPPLRVAY
ncbi:hypothetical protein [Aliiruegeria sabulilitoris]|uniref:hypothetical protein n=1 Tax=Aliiruegeria sabulilitoris TaxID=1510458 RepID=UPI0008300006|nr:hypothetical protein [Aliiruegeria sabulilitoris]NDR57682.1 hypothetical protein [Pseudoruegeria sp. M32A2M]